VRHVLNALLYRALLAHQLRGAITHSIAVYMWCIFETASCIRGCDTIYRSSSIANVAVPDSRPSHTWWTRWHFLLSAAAPVATHGEWYVDGDTTSSQTLPTMIMRMEDVGGLRACTMSRDSD
jgi:hypothetical protein